MHTSMKVRTDFKAKALAIAMKRKEEYLGARVPKELKERVIKRAKDLDIPVSLLIRKVLEEAFAGTRRPYWDPDIKGTDNDALASARFPSVLGWESIRLNRSATCAGCGTELRAGKQVTMGISPPEEARILLCNVCRESL